MCKRLLLLVFLSTVFCLPLQATGDIYGPVDRRDTLWNIAEKLSPAKNLTVQQVMMALYQKNPHAFTVNNISSLRKGAHLLAPTAAEVQRIKRETAVAMVQRHNTRWKKRRFVKTNAPMPTELKQKLAAQAAVGAAAERQENTVLMGPLPLVSKEAVPAQTAAASVQTAQNQPQTTDAPRSTVAAPTSQPDTTQYTAQLSAQLNEVQRELAQTRVENQRLKDEMRALKNSQTQTLGVSEDNQNIQIQLDALKHELAELRSILSEKNNHIKVLQASLKEASVAIKSQHADNMRLYNKLRELSPESVAVMEANQVKETAQPTPLLELAEVSTQAEMPLAGNANAAQTDNAGITQVWADESPDRAAGALKAGSSVTLGDILSNQSTPPAAEQAEAQSLGFSFSNTRSAKVSPIAWAAVLISFVFILFMIVRALLMQNELRRFEIDDTAS